jgi:hypothetical protein
LAGTGVSGPAPVTEHLASAGDGRPGQLLVIEGIVAPGNEPSISKFFDLAMRTVEEYQQLYAAGGFA